ncbi:hypothetical protein [Caulobacter sp. Root1455]|uniref:hypothetical protein n=1 Tax=Caulobacter sp. Root1455 TaxID=1736465 RepID=UPI0012E3AC2E|nr:hypothetical protein [Caulobacter sp. Root1455]
MKITPPLALEKPTFSPLTIPDPKDSSEYVHFIISLFSDFSSEAVLLSAENAIADTNNAPIVRRNILSTIAIQSPSQDEHQGVNYISSTSWIEAGAHRILKLEDAANA